MRLGSILKCIKNSSGAAIIEFAFVVPSFVFLTFAAFQFAYIIIISSILESAMFDATRLAKVSDSTAATVNAIRQAIQTQSMGVIDANEIVITTDLNADLAENWQNAPAEPCKDAAGLIIPGQFCPCSIAWSDDNHDGECDVGPPPLALEAPGNIVRFMVFYKMQPLIPTFGFMATVGGKIGIVSTTVVRNEPA